MIGFEILRERLLEHLRHRIRNGEVTERALALKAGISQPHMHNLLKGVRCLNADMGDQLLTTSAMTVLDLIAADELRRALFFRSREDEPTVEVPVLKGRLGPGLPWPHQPGLFERVNVPLRKTARIPHPIVARLADDPDMSPVLNAGDLVLLDTGDDGRESTDPDTLFAVEYDGQAGVRWIRRGRRGLYLVSAVSRDRPREWTVVQDCASTAVRARAIPLRSIHPPELLYDPLLQPRDKPRGPARRSGAN